MRSRGWTLLFHDGIVAQLRRLHEAAERARKSDPANAAHNANVKLFDALATMIVDVVPTDPGKDEYRQGNTLGAAHRHWRRAKIGRRFRLFFRYDSGAKIIVYAWVNDEHTLRAAGSKSDPYAVFGKMLARGDPPDDWATLVAASGEDWQRTKGTP